MYQSHYFDTVIITNNKCQFWHHNQQCLEMIGLHFTSTVWKTNCFKDLKFRGAWWTVAFETNNLAKIRREENHVPLFAESNQNNSRTSSSTANFLFSYSQEATFWDQAPKTELSSPLSLKRVQIPMWAFINSVLNLFRQTSGDISLNFLNRVYPTAQFEQREIRTSTWLSEGFSEVAHQLTWTSCRGTQPCKDFAFLRCWLAGYRHWKTEHFWGTRQLVGRRYNNFLLKANDVSSRQRGGGSMKTHHLYNETRF